MPRFKQIKLGFLFRALLYLCRPSFGRLERKHPMIALRHRYDDHQVVSRGLSEDGRGHEKVDAVLYEPSYQTVFTITISQTFSPLPTNAITVTIGGTVATQSLSATATFTGAVQSSMIFDPTPTSTTNFTSLANATFTVSTTTTISSRVITTQVNKISTSSIGTTSTAVAPSSSSNPPSTNLQTFTDALGNISAPPVFDTGNGQFLVEGNSSFDNKQNALARSCDVQHNDCGNTANADHDISFTVNDCDAQEAKCKAVAAGS